jgi:hypothetical protein
VWFDPAEHLVDLRREDKESRCSAPVTKVGRPDVSLRHPKGKALGEDATTHPPQRPTCGVLVVAERSEEVQRGGGEAAECLLG